MSDYTITEEEAIEWTTAWRTDHPTLVKAFKVDKAEIDEIFEDDNAVAMRSYLAIKDGSPALVMVGVNAEGKDILTKFYDFAEPCPNVCDESSPLTGG